MIWWLLLGFGFLVVSFLLTAPIVLELNSDESRYEFRMGSAIRLRVIRPESQVLLCLSVFGIRFTFDPRNKRTADSKNKDAAKHKKGWRPKLTPTDLLRKFKQLIRVVEVQWFEADLDTDDFATNALLFPIAYFASKDQRQIRINFQGTNSLRLQLVTTGSRLLAAVLT